MSLLLEMVANAHAAAPQLPTPATSFCGVQASCYVYMLYNWQTLIGGLIAIGAAVYAGHYVRRQIRVSETIEADRLQRRERAARAILPLALTKFIDFTEECALILRTVSGSLVPAASATQPPLFTPQIPQQPITDLERAIEAATEPLTVEIMAKLAAHTQVLHSIIADIVAHVNRSGSARYRRDPNLPAFELRTARVHAAASRLFSWARGEAEKPDDVSWDHIETSLSLLNLRNEATTQFLMRNQERGAHPLAW